MSHNPKKGIPSGDIFKKLNTYENIIKNSAVIFFEHDISGYFTFLSPQIEEILGYSPDEIKVKWQEMISGHPANEIALERTDTAIRTGKRQQNYEVEMLTKDGKNVWLEISEAPVVENGAVVSVIGSATDITERKIANAKLELSEEKFSKAFFNSPNAITLTSFEDGKIIEINEFGANLLGYKRNEIIGKTSVELNIISADDRKRLLRELELHGSYSNLELKVRTKSGEERIGLHYGQPINVGNNKYLFQTVTDITEIRQAERALKDSEEKFSKAFYLSPDGIIISRMDNGEIVDLNKGFEKIFGYSREEAIGKTTIDLNIYQNLSDRNHILNTVKKSGSIKNYEACFIDKNKNLGISEISSQQIRIANEDFLLTIVRDITNSKIAQDELKTSEEKFSKAFFSNQDGMILTKASDGKIIEMNDGIERIFGYPRKDALGRTTFELRFWKNIADRENVLNILKAEGRVTNYIAEYNTKTGNTGTAELSLELIKIKNEDHLLTTVRDITQRIIIEGEIKEYQKNLKLLASELTLAEERERRRIAVNLHDHLGQSLAMTKIRLAEAVKEKSYSSVIEKVQSARKFLDDAITNSRLITYELSPPILYELGFTSAIRWQLDQVSEEHGIKTNIEEISAKPIKLNEEVRILLFRAVLEIINNSIKHAQATELSIVIKAAEKSLRIIIQDNGKGFDPKEAMKNATKNRSFGLFSLRERISYLNGEIDVNSQLNKGTRTTIKIPY